MQFPILPCDLCGSQENLQRKIIGDLLSRLEKDNPGLRTSALAALMNVRPSHLLDAGLWKKLGLEVAREEIADEVSVGRGTEVRGEPAPPSELAPCSTCWFPVSMRGA